MDAIKFVKERQRMCRFYGYADNCYQCPAKDCECSTLEYMVDDNRIFAIIEKLSKEHPAKTRQSVFLEQWPEAEIDENGYLMLCPLTVSADKRNKHCDCTTLKCTNCRREFWMQEVE
nr:MAG TPA: hypothetical protein [Caudoviricetes sp.]